MTAETKPRQPLLRRLWRFVLLPLTVLTAVLGVFMFLVNSSPGFAAACAKLPVLGALSEGLRFQSNRFYTVDNEYCQTLNLAQTRGDTTVRVDFLVVDQQTVTVFYHLETKQPERYYLSPRAWLSDGTDAFEGCETLINDYSEGPLAGLNSFTLIFPGEVPPTLQLQLKLYAYDREASGANAAPASFDFLLRYDPTLTSAGRHYPQNRTVLLEKDLEEEKPLHITDVEVCPDHVKICVEGDPADRRWYHYLRYELTTPEGLTLRTDDPIYAPRDVFYGTEFLCDPAGGVEKAVLRVDSVLLESCESLTLVIKGFDYRTEMEPNSPYVDLVRGTAERLPAGVELIRVVRDGEDWLLTFRCEDEGLPERDVFVAYDSFQRPCCWIDWTYGGNPGLAAAVEDLPALSAGQYQIARLRSYPYDGVYLTRQMGVGVYLTEPVRVTFPLN